MSMEEKGRIYRCEEGVTKKEKKKMHAAAGKSKG